MIRKGIITCVLQDKSVEMEFTADVEASVNPDSKQLTVAVRLTGLTMEGKEADVANLPPAFVTIVTNAIADQAAADFPASDYLN